MKEQNIFKRYEMKYLISRSQQKYIKRQMEQYMCADRYGGSTVCNIYFDTPSYLLIRRSLDGPVYKEKLRLRSYGVATPGSKTFLELKKKYQKVVHKRRVAMPEKEAMCYLCNGVRTVDSQIIHEIDYFMRFYDGLQPKVFLSYRREAFFGAEDADFRVTFDENILWRDDDLSLCSGIYGLPLLDSGQVLMEVKATNSIPLWMTALLSENQIHKTSFSKYGNAYRAILLGAGQHEEENTGGVLYA